jgi:hypothetical protein
MTAFSVGTGTAFSVAPGAGNTPDTPTVPPSLAMQVQPVGAASTSPLSTQPVVRALDKFGNLDASFSGLVTASINGTGSLSGGIGITANLGVATFTDLVITGAGSSTLTFTATGYTPVTSTAITTT